MGLGSFFKKMFGKGDVPVAPVAQGTNPGVPGAVDTVGTMPSATPSAPLAGPEPMAPEQPAKTA